MQVRSLSAAEPFTTADGSTIREIVGHDAAQNQTLAEATLAPGQATERHYHGVTEEIYFVLEGSGEMEVDGQRATVRAGDAVVIPTGAWHEIRATDGQLRFLCCCAPGYRHADTYFS